MAINRRVEKRTLNLVVDNGVDLEGNMLTKAYSFSGIKADASMENIKAAGEALGGLYLKELQGVMLTEKAELETAAA